MDFILFLNRPDKHSVPRQSGDLLRLDLSLCALTDADVIALVDAIQRAIESHHSGASSSASSASAAGGSASVASTGAAGDASAPASAASSSSHVKKALRCSLHSLWLESNLLTDAACARLGQLLGAFGRFSALRRVSIAGNTKMGAQGKVCVCEQPQRSTSLFVICLACAMVLSVICFLSWSNVVMIAMSSELCAMCPPFESQTVLQEHLFTGEAPPASTSATSVSVATDATALSFLNV